jgi:hypothetical protein
MSLRGISGMFYVMVGLIAIIAYVLGLKIAENTYSYVWLVLVGILFLSCGSFLFIHR